MRTAAILPVKSFGAAKQRLGSLLGAGSRHALAQAMFQDVLSSLRKVEGIERIVIVADEPSVEFAADEQVVVLEDEVRDGQSPAALAGIRWATASGFERVLLVPGDTPLLAAQEVDELLADAPEDVVIVPDRHGTGTNALLLRPPTPRASPIASPMFSRSCTTSTPRTIWRWSGRRSRRVTPLRRALAGRCVSSTGRARA